MKITHVKSPTNFLMKKFNIDRYSLMTVVQGVQSFIEKEGKVPSFSKCLIDKKASRMAGRCMTGYCDAAIEAGLLFEFDVVISVRPSAAQLQQLISVAGK